MKWKTLRQKERRKERKRDGGGAYGHRIPFFVAAPTTTLDPELEHGGLIPIEERHPEEVTHFRGEPVAAPGINVCSLLPSVHRVLYTSCSLLPAVHRVPRGHVVWRHV